MCPRCGGRMTYVPDGGSLVCEYCRRHDAMKPEVLNQKAHDFIAAMATEGAHRKPLREQIAHCQGCGAEFIIPAVELSFECAYCGSAHVVNTEGSKDFMAPDRILPHAFDRGRAKGLLGEWIDKAKIVPDPPVGPPRGLYLPVWTFLLGGRVDYTAEQHVDGLNGRYGPERRDKGISDSIAVQMEVSVAASNKPSAPLCAVDPHVRHARAETVRRAASRDVAGRALRCKHGRCFAGGTQPGPCQDPGRHHHADMARAAADYFVGELVHRGIPPGLASGMDDRDRRGWDAASCAGQWPERNGARRRLQPIRQVQGRTEGVALGSSRGVIEEPGPSPALPIPHSTALDGTPAQIWQ